MKMLTIIDENSFMRGVAPDTPEVRAKGLGCGRSGLETVCRSQFSEVGLNGRAEAPW